MTTNSDARHVEPAPVGLAGRHPATLALLGWFEYGHLPEHLRAPSKLFGDVAQELVRTMPDSAELSSALRKLLEAKDCVVRAAVAAHRYSAADGG